MKKSQLPAEEEVLKYKVITEITYCNNGFIGYMLVIAI